MKIYFVRHGQTNWNVLEKAQGKADIELNEKGISQAKETAEKLKNEDIDLIICSPLKRAKKTAEIINQNRNIKMIFDDKISERDFGEYEGENTSDFDYDEFWNYSKNRKYKKAENIKELFERIYNFIDELKIKYKDLNVLIVAHGGVSIPFKCYFEGIPDTNESLLKMCTGNCEILKFNID